MLNIFYSSGLHVVLRVENVMWYWWRVADPKHEASFKAKPKWVKFQIFASRITFYILPSHSIQNLNFKHLLYTHKTMTNGALFYLLLDIYILKYNPRRKTSITNAIKLVMILGIHFSYKLKQLFHILFLFCSFLSPCSIITDTAKSLVILLSEILINLLGQMCMKEGLGCQLS